MTTAPADAPPEPHGSGGDSRAEHFPSAAALPRARDWIELALGLGLSAAAAGLVFAQATPPRASRAAAGDVAPALRERGAAAPVSTTTTAPEVASYTIEAKLNPDTHLILGSERVAWTNASSAAVSSIFVHLYLNAFKNDQTLFLRSPFNASRGSVRAKEFGFIDVKSLRATEYGEQDLWGRRAPHSPGDALDETDIEVPLPSPVPPGGRLTLDIRFEARLPGVVERTGHSGRFHFVAQWFPKLARLEPNGSFAHFAFHPQAEFYADFGNYDVTLEVPEQFTLAASGQRVEQRVQGGQRRERYVARAVHDFAWSTWDQFEQSEAVLPSQLGSVKVKVFTPPGYAAVSRGTHAAVAWSLPYFERHFGAYPYSTLTVVHPPPTAAEAGGMEYPTLITTGGSWYSPHTPVRDLDSVVVHELGHQWFYGLLASNEAEWPFLDEGLNSFAEDSALRAAHGAGSLFQGFGLSVAKDYAGRVFSSLRGHDEAIAEPAGAFSTFRNLGALVYARTSVLLETVARVWGRPELEQALASYAARFRFAHPTPQDFLSHMESTLGHEVRSFLEAGLFARGSLNYVVREVQTARDEPPRGFFDKAGQRTELQGDTNAFAPHRSRAVVYRHGSLEAPVDVLLLTRGGQRHLEHWDGRGSYHVFEYTGSEPIEQVVVDPEHKLLIEDSLFDNQASTQAASLPRLEERLGYFTELLMGLLP